MDLIKDVDAWREKYSNQDCDIDNNKLPIIYRKEHNISLPFKLNKLHAFDSEKFGNIANRLVANRFCGNNEFIKATKVSDDQLNNFHDSKYLDSLNWSTNIAAIIEFPLASFVPNFILQSYIMNPIKYHTGASILSGEMALLYGWAINLGGGMHHASYSSGGGWCFFSDIGMSINNLRKKKLIDKVMIIDLDVHRGNGHEINKLVGKLGNKNNTYIMDMYNKDIYPGPGIETTVINKKITVKNFCKGDEYINKLVEGLHNAFSEFKPDIIYYNAGTDILANDPLGCLSVESKYVIKRDELVFGEAFRNKIPIVMLLSGGYQENNSVIITKSIINLENKFKIKQMAKTNYDKIYIKDNEDAIEIDQYLLDFNDFYDCS